MERNEPDWPTEPTATGPGGRRGGGREKWSLRKKLVVWGCSALAAVIVVVGIGLVVAWRHLNGNIKTQDAGLKPSAMSGKQDILFIGSDSRSGGNQTLGGGDVSGARSDTAMVFDSPADRRQGTEVSIPRDSMVQIPDCTSTGTGGTTVAANFGMFNSAFTEGGAPCTVKTVESLTGLTLTHYIAIDFEGVVGVVNALGGVKVCVTQAIDDADSGLNIPAGTTTLNGQQALAFVRLRHTVGDGSDLERIQRQQYFLDQLEHQVRSAGLLTDPVKLYKVLDAATQSITTDPGLGTVTDLYSLAQTLNAIPNGKFTYVTVPNEPYPEDTNRVVWTEPDATSLWNSLIDEANTAGASASSSASTKAAALGGSTSSSAAEVALSRFEGVMKLVLLADTPTDATGSASSSAGSTSSPGGADVGTCPVG
ncbi:LCP family protein [Actinospica sp.]|jgi:LCP family protein required for cell wall assembly|uniref:LCP family protein n=1 Tax=Actinospica sp. TaxID=1872142 RepID=UPI002BA05BDF|nr:LCP family protein [Actinospica sp.]HWG22913.1 LCP family protein [Actinospica sp.]